MKTQEEAEALAKKKFEEYMNEMDLKSLDDAKLATQSFLSIAFAAFETTNDENVKMEFLN